MCGIVGWIDLKRNIKNQLPVMQKMTDTLSKRGPDSFGTCAYTNALLGHRRLIVVDPTGGSQPMTKKIGNTTYTIVYNGELYNTEDIREKLSEKGYRFKSYSDTEVLLTSYIEWGPECVNHLNGIFAFGIWNEQEKSLFLARDPLGVKPLFYSFKDSSIIFASEIKALLENPMVEPVVDQTGLLEIFGLGPARSLGSGIFKDIKEVPPAFSVIFNKNGIRLIEYWKLKAKEHTENLDTTTEHVRTLLVDAIKRQLTADVPVCTFLSGGLDSSAISAVAAEEFKKKGQILSTYSIDYLENDIYFKANEYQPDSDAAWALRMVDFIGSDHHNVLLDNKDVADALKDAVIANDLPGMADIDSSLYLFCKEVRKDNIVALSGECADEIFGGYPWFRRQEDINANTFPWSKNVKDRVQILSDDLNKLQLEEYVKSKYDEALSNVPHISNESAEEHRMKELFYLNIKWFMITLLNRKDRMSMSNSLEVRVPFADYRIVEYAFNIPNEMKLYQGREKGLLRRSLRGILPNDVIERKKSPYPKTHHPVYTKLVQEEMRKVLENKNSPILDLINTQKVSEIVETGGAAYVNPWYGQLMKGPQLIAYLIQLNYWLEKYNVKIKY